MRLRSLAFLCATLLTVACGPGGRGKGGGVPEALRGLPERKDPPLALDDDDDLGRARSRFDAMAPGDGDRSARRKELWAAYEARVTAELESGSRDDAFRWFQSGLELWDPVELQQSPVPDLGITKPLAHKVYDTFAATGGDAEAVTALVVLMAAEPERAADYVKLYDDIAAYADDLAVADGGEGAKRKRPIEILEGVTAHFGSAWAGDTLVKLYLERQDQLVAALGKGGDEPETLAVHGEGILMPVWNIVRAYARTGRIHLAQAVVDKLADQYGDEPRLREALKTAMSQQATGAAFLELAQWMIDEKRPGNQDWVTGRRICELGVRRLPKDPAVRFCAGKSAFVGGNMPLAIRWLEAAYQLEPTDEEVADILARAYLIQMRDDLLSERIDAAREDLKKIEQFHAKLKLKKPLEAPSDLATAYLQLGQGLYAQGEIADAQAALSRPELAKDPDARESLGQIAMKRGDYATAARHFAAAAELPRESKLDELQDRAHLRRLAGEAYAAGGDAKSANELFLAAKKELAEVLSHQITVNRHIDAQIEQARVAYDLGDVRAAVTDITEAVTPRRGAEPPGLNLYGDVIAFLVARGHYDEALDVYHRLMASEEGTEYLKIYPSLWIVSLARMRGIEPDRQAIDFLSTRRGTRWYHDLARFATGQLTADQVIERATSRGKRAEAYFYTGLGAYAAGDKAEGDRRMKLVLQTDMFGFYEFDMAQWLLAHPLK